MKKIMKILVLFLALFVLISCGEKTASKDSAARSEASTAAKKRDILNVTVSIPPQAFIVKTVGKDKVKVNTMMEPSSTPETYEPGPQKMANLKDSALYLKIGVPFEAASINKLAADYPNLKFADMHKGIALRKMGKHGGCPKCGSGECPCKGDKECCKKHGGCACLDGKCEGCADCKCGCKEGKECGCKDGKGCPHCDGKECPCKGDKECCKKHGGCDCLNGKGCGCHGEKAEKEEECGQDACSVPGFDAPKAEEHKYEHHHDHAEHEHEHHHHDGNHEDCPHFKEHHPEKAAAAEKADPEKCGCKEEGKECGCHDGKGCPKCGGKECPCKGDKECCKKHGGCDCLNGNGCGCKEGKECKCHDGKGCPKCGGKECPCKGDKECCKKHGGCNCLNGKGCHGHHHHHGMHDPHVWLDPMNLVVMTDNTVAELSAADPENAAFYRENGENLKKEIQKVADEVTAELKDFAGKSFVIYHPSFGYFADRFGLKQLPLEIEGKEPSAEEMAKVVDFIKQNNAKVIFMQAQLPDTVAKSVAEETKTRVVTLDPLAENVLENIKKTANEIKGALVDEK